MLEFLKKNPVTYAMGHFVMSRRMAILAARHLKKERKRPKPAGPIRVGFLCQYLPAWSKVSAIYEKMLADPRFEPCLICVPSEQVMGKDSFAITPENDTYDYFISQGYDAINALEGPNQWLDLETLGLSYLFYPRPYQHLLPGPYNTWLVSQYCRVCILMYGMVFAKEDMQTALNQNFMSHVYFYFAENTFAQTANRKLNRLGHRLGLQKSVCLGLPVLENLQKKQGCPSPAWDFSDNTFRVLWTPRWTTDKKLGGTNFFTYYQALLDFAEQNPDMAFLHRPHPLALSHFQETGEMTPQQVQDYIARCEHLENVALDKLPAYETTFWGSSVLVSDVSGMVPEYFFTGKPLIFCATNMELTLAPYIRRLLEGCYVVNNQEELFQTLRDLKNGQDPLAEKRKQIALELFGDPNLSPSSNIIEALAEDFGNRKE